jgi:hypothetical protein
VTKILNFPKKRSKGKSGGGGGSRPPDEEIARVLREVSLTLQDAALAIQRLEADVNYLEAAQARHSKYLLTIVQALLRSGIELPLTSKKPEDK